MKKIHHFLISVGLILSLVSCSQADGDNTVRQPISGTVINGYRILRVPNTHFNVSLSVYRGDYVKFKFDKTIPKATLTIPELEINNELPRNFKEAPYFKMKTTGTFAFSLGGVNGTLDVVEYQQTNYREVTSLEGANIIKDRAPIILDVRTSREYKSGHLDDAVLIPVQELQARLKELSDYKDRDILVYCATGNRSTVASKILIENGFKHILNMRYGIADWYKNNYPIEQ